jgi:hypothetical protein
MAIELSPDVSTRNQYLARTDTLVLDNAKGVVVEVERGCVWITLEGDPRDIVLVSGTSFTIDRGGRTVAVAEADSQVRIHRKLGALTRLADAITRRLSPAYVNWAERHARRAMHFL